MPVPEGLDWYIWRVLTSDKLHVTLTELKTSWSLLDLAEAHDALDVLDSLNRVAKKRAEVEAERDQ